VIAHLGAARSRVVPDTQDAMTWSIGDDGFRMTLSPCVPEALASHLPEFVGDALAGTEAWCVHPGGRAVLDSVQSALALPPTALVSARGVLRDVGNVSSAGVLFVLARELERARPGDRGLMLGFGPGLTLQARPVTRGARSIAPPASSLLAVGLS
jgi:predicted naringenin-chalcone synthase